MAISGLGREANRGQVAQGYISLESLSACGGEAGTVHVCFKLLASSLLGCDGVFGGGGGGGPTKTKKILG
jgi:hypothetical protein